MLLEEKNPILTVRLPDGSTQSIIALQGTSAYEMARSQGYEGTEVEFRDALARVTGAFDWVWNGGKESGPSPILYFGQNEYSFSPIPSASSTASGIVTTTAQSLAGEKTFTEGIFLPTLHASRIRGEGNVSSYWNSYKFSLLSVDTKDNEYRPLISTRTPAGGNWTLVNYNNENLMLVYTDSEQCEGTSESPGGANGKGKRLIINFTPQGGLTTPGLITGNGGLATTTGTFSSTITATGKITGNGGLATTTISATAGTFSSTSTVLSTPQVTICRDSVKSGTNTTIRNSLVIHGATYGNTAADIKTEGQLSYGDPGPQLIFGTNNTITSSQKIALIYTDNDSIHTGNSLTFTSTEAKTAFIVPTGTVSAKNLFIQNPSSVTGAGVTGHFHPSANNSYYLGNSAYRWQYLYINNINVTGSITSTNNITSTGTISTTGNFVTTANNRGFKVFNDGKTFSLKLHMGNGGENRGLYDGEDASGGLKDWALYWNKSNNALINAKDRFIPEKAGGIYLGDSDHRWKNIYTLNLNNSGSDIRNKIVQDDIILKKLLLVYDSVVPIAYKWKNSELGNSTHDRVHIGLSAQEVEEKMYENKLTRMDFGGLCVDPVYETDENGDKTDKIIDEQYSLRYGEFHGLHILKNQQQDIRIKDLEEKNQQLENTIAELKTQLELIKLAIGG